MDYRRAVPSDTASIASLHADSWRRNYRGAFPDAFLDGDVAADRLAVWTARLNSPGPDHHTVVADDKGVLAGFVHTILDDDPTWGALVDNLHVSHDRKRHGVGTRLMARSAAAVLTRTPGAGLYLWVLEGNRSAQAFYGARRGTCVGREASEAPGGGTIVGLRYAWPDPSVLL